MSRRDFRTPANLPLETVGRCIVVPDDAAWLGLLNAALLMLTEHWRYDQVETTDLTPEETAAIWYDIYVSTLTSACDDCPDMNCNDVLACIADAGYLLSSPNLPDDQRVIGGVPQVSFDGGTTWVDVAGDSSAPPLVANPKPTSGADDSAKICLASTRAALVLAEFYKQTFGAFTADITNALGTFNNFLQELNSALLGLAYGQAAQMLNAEIMRDQDWETNYTAAELSAGNLEDLLCLLVGYASVDSAGVVTFDYGAIRDNIIAGVGINPGTALWFLLGNIQESGLNASGSVSITDTPLDCSECLEPCVTCETTTRTHYTATNAALSGGSLGTPPQSGSPDGLYYVNAPAELSVSLDDVPCVKEVRASMYNAYDGNTGRWSAAELFINGVSYGVRNLTVRTSCGSGTESSASWILPTPVRASSIQIAQGAVPAGIKQGALGMFACVKVTKCVE